MDESKVSREGSGIAPGSDVSVKVTRQLETEADNEIETRPTYINHVQLLRAGTDVFLDIGIVPMDDLANFSEKREMRFVILDRLVMGLETFVGLHDAVMGLHVQLKQAGILPNEKLIK
jgi:hypothetical protein